MNTRDDDLLPDERALLEGKTLNSDKDEPVQAAADLDDETPADAPAEPAAESGEEAAAPVEAKDEVVEPTRPTYDSTGERDFKAERTALRSEEATIERKWSEGELSDEDRATQLNDVRDKLDDVLRAQTRADTIADLNRQAAAQEQQKALSAVAQASAKAGELDYSDQKVAAAFDRMIAAVLSDPDNAGKPFAEIAQMTHAALCATRGVQRQVATNATPPKGDKPSQASMRATIPQTLGNMPPAAAAPVGNDALTSLAAMDDPDAAEASLAAMSATQRKALLRSTMPTARRH
jgi:hypothetical protein